MNHLIPLQFEGETLRIIDAHGDPWFVLSDLCKVHGLTNPSAQTKSLDPDEYSTFKLENSGRGRSTLIVSEAGMLKIILRSDDAIKPGTKAHRLMRFLVHEVLPSIRKHGCYPPPPVPDLAALPIDTEGPWDGVNKSMGQRFREERERWEAETGYRLIDCPTMNKQVVFAIENNLGGIRKGRRIEMLLYAGIDVLYVLTGRRTLTRAERAMCDAYRRADPAQRALVFGTAIALPPADDLA